VIVVEAAFAYTRLLAQREAKVAASLLGLRVREFLDGPHECPGVPGNALVGSIDVRALAGAIAAGGAALRGDDAIRRAFAGSRCVVDAWLEAPQDSI
jgi:hypothetical protein